MIRMVPFTPKRLQDSTRGFKFGECVIGSNGQIRFENDPDDSGGLTFAGIAKASNREFPFDHPHNRSGSQHLLSFLMEFRVRERVEFSSRRSGGSITNVTQRNSGGGFCRTVRSRMGSSRSRWGTSRFWDCRSRVLSSRAATTVVPLTAVT